MTIADRFRRIKALGSHKIRDFAVNPPAPADDRRGLAIVCIVRNAAHDIPEWIDFHLRAGVSHFLIYDNASTDGIAATLGPLRDRGIVTLLPWNLAGQDADTGRRITPQVTAYAHALTTFGGRFEHLAFIDVDEFLVPKSAPTLMEAIAKAGSPSNMSLPWHMFGHGGHETRPPGGVVRNFTARAVLPYARPDLLLHHKCIVDPCRVTMVSVHYFRTSDLGDRTANALGRIVPHAARKSPDFFTSGGIQLNHYHCMSKADLQAKLARGPVNFASAESYRTRVLSTVAEIERATEQDLTAVRFLDSGTA
jgi:hypothetical protein